MTTEPEKGKVDFLQFLGGFASAFFLIFSGVKMFSIHSIASQIGEGTIAEAYYNAMGWGFIGLGVFTGILLISLSLKN